MTGMGPMAVDALYLIVTRTGDAREGRLAGEYLGKLADDLADRIVKDM